MVLNTGYPFQDDHVNQYQQYDRVIKKIKERVKTYGFHRIKTPAFEKYDLYTEVNSSVNRNKMIKVVDYTGEVLVIRPDVTIPITRSFADDEVNGAKEARYFYVQDVFRQPFDRSEDIESTQAGIEYFGNQSAEADAEVIALACEVLSDLGFHEVKIEIGHAGFFQELIQQVELTSHELKELKMIIQAKNIVEIRPFLEKLAIDDWIAQAMEEIPFLYGNPEEVAKRAKKLTLSASLHKKLDHLLEVYKIVRMYGLADNVIMDLGLINYMGYYSDIIFQGFVENLGQPVLMGGRYDQLAENFGKQMPAIGFACQIESILEALPREQIVIEVNDDLYLFYRENEMKTAIQWTKTLREYGYSVIAKRKQSDQMNVSAKAVVRLEKGGGSIQLQDSQKKFTDLQELLEILKGGL